MEKFLAGATNLDEGSNLFSQPENLKIAVDLVLDAFENESQHEAATKVALDNARSLPDATVSQEVQQLVEQLGLLMVRSYRQASSNKNFYQYQR